MEDGRTKAWLRRVLRSTAWVGLALLLPAALGAAGLHFIGRVRFAGAFSQLEEAFGGPIPPSLPHPAMPTPAREENAAAWILDAWSLLDLDRPARERLEAASGMPRHRWPPELEEGVRASLERNRQALEKLHRAGELERSSFGIDYSDPDPEVPSLLPAIPSARLLAAEARLAYSEGDAETGLAAARALARLATALDREDWTISALLGWAAEAQLHLVVSEVLEDGLRALADPVVLRRLEESLPTADPLERARELVVIESLATSRRLRSAELSGSLPWWTRSLFGWLAEAQALDDARLSLERFATQGPAPPVSVAEAEPAGNAPSLLEVYSLYPAHLEHSLPDPYAPEVRATRLRFAFHLLQATPAALRPAATPQALTWSDLYLKLAVRAGQRQLLRAGLSLRRTGLHRGGYPLQRPEMQDLTQPTPFTGRLLAYRPRSDGSLELELTGAVERLQWIYEDLRRPGGDRGERDEALAIWLHSRVLRLTLPPAGGAGD